ncbi:unnamed protein product [Paramecium sonneborni]|uniref:PX domain-containing protein n=1 Tax=Paramecium sonneborni TaxID=65129 RepID=A0A8S1RGV5_9CILI|nr:unnamed protein product [Paramecium sonneborni]
MQTYAYAFIVPSALSIVYIIMMICRYYDLKSDIVANKISLNCSIKFRMTLLIFDIGIQSIQCAMIFLCQNCEEYHNYFMIILLINIVTLILQIYLMIFEYKKRVPLFFAHKLYWIANWMVLLMIVALIINYQAYLLDTILILVRILLISIILIYTLFVRKQDLVEFEDLGFFNSELPDIDVSSQGQKLRISTLNNFQTQFFSVELQKMWNIVDNDIEIKLNIHFIDNEKSMKLKKRLTQLFEMHQKLIIECQAYFDLHNNDLLELDYLIKQIQESSHLQLIQAIQKYFNVIMSKVDLISSTFLDFIELPQQERELLDEIKLQNKQLHKQSLIKKQQTTLSYKKWELQEQFIPYMNVKIRKHQTIKQQHSDSFIQYIIVIKINQDRIISQKRFREFHELHEQLKQQGIKYSSLFPQKIIGKLTELDVEQRQRDLEIYLKVLLNDRTNHNSLQLFKFVGLSANQDVFLKKQYQRIQKDVEQVCQCTVKFLQFEEVQDQFGDKYFRYQFQFFNNNIYNLNHIISKRYSQFDELHNILKQRSQYFLPLLPQKSLQQNINPNQRSALLLQYLNELIKIPQVCENPHFRQFIDIPFFYFESEEVTIPESTTQFNQILRHLDNDSIIWKIDDMKVRLWE